MKRPAGSVGRTSEAESYLRAERAAVEAALEATLETTLAGVPPALAEPIRYAVEDGGKRLRPILCVAAYRAAVAGTGDDAGDEPGADPEAADAIYGVAAGIELIHGYSLVHDDLPCMDDDDLRRGRPATHRAFGTRRATLAGAALIPVAFEAVGRAGRRLGLTGAESAALVGELARGAGGGGMVGGQLMDLRAEGGTSSVADLEAIHLRKTGALITAALRIGGRAARADAAVLEALGRYGRGVGLAFQIADDVLDVTATSDVLGKTAGKDAAAAKATFPAALGVDAARRRAREQSERAVDAVRAAGVATPELEMLARYAVERER